MRTAATRSRRAGGSGWPRRPGCATCGCGCDVRRTVRVAGSLDGMLRRPRVLLAAAAACALAAALVYALVLHVAVLQRADLRVLEGFVDLRGANSGRAADDLARLFDPVPFGALVAALTA